MPTTDPEQLLGTLKRTAAVLNRSGVPFALAGKFAVHARGGPLSDHDVDFLIREQDANRALSALAEDGFRPVHPPEDWLVKVYDEDRLVDLIFRPADRPVTKETLEDTDDLPLKGIRLPVLSATELIIHTLLTFAENYCDFSKALPAARALREQVDWSRVTQETAHSPYAYAFLILLERLGVIAFDDVPTAASHLDGESP